MFTIVVAIKNSSTTFSRCLKSILAQTYRDKELIIMDGGSTDGTLSILSNFSDAISYCESKPDRGIYHAWNKALMHADGEWICFLGADDYFPNFNVLSDLLPHLKRARDAGVRIVYGQAAKVDAEGRLIKLKNRPWEKTRWLMPHGMPLIHSGIMHHRDLFKDHGIFDESFVIAGDYEFLLRELKTGDAIFAKGINTVNHQVGGLSDALKVETLLEIQKARLIHKLPRFSCVWTAVFLRAYLQNRLSNLLKKLNFREKPKSD